MTNDTFINNTRNNITNSTKSHGSKFSEFQLSQLSANIKVDKNLKYILSKIRQN